MRAVNKPTFLAVGRRIRKSKTNYNFGILKRKIRKKAYLFSAETHCFKLIAHVYIHHIYTDIVGEY